MMLSTLKSHARRDFLQSPSKTRDRKSVCGGRRRRHHLLASIRHYGRIRVPLLLGRGATQKHILLGGGGESI